MTFTYDAAGNLTGYDDGTTSAGYTYDDAYRKATETVNYPGFSLTNSYSYYKNGLKQSYTGPDGIVMGYLYDANNQLTGIQIPGVGMFTVNGYDWNRPAAETLPGGSTRRYAYDPLMRVSGITTRDPGGNEQLNYGYTYDKVDNITAKATEHGRYDYSYDELYRLTDSDNPDQADESFDYDAVGNRTASARTTGQWSYNANNELEAYDDVSFQYDANGNMIAKNAGGIVTLFFYNLEDRLERVEDGSGNVIASYYYDPFGRRLWKDVGGTRICFHYSDEGLVGEYDATGAQIKTYGWKPGSTWSTDPLFMKIGNQYYWYHNDHLGTPHKITSGSGAVVWRAKYSSFGKASVDSASTVVNPLRFPGQYEDAETGLHYNLFRYYSCDIGRYVSSDPIGLLGGTNRYIYSLNNSILRVDPFGLSSADAIRQVAADPGVLTGIGTAIAAFVEVCPPSVLIAGSLGIGYSLGAYIEGKYINGAIGEWIYDITHPTPILMDEVFTTDEGIVIVIPDADPNLRDWCIEQIQDAQDFCIDQYSKPNSAIPKGVCGDPDDGPGGWPAIQRCVERNIPEICGGDPVS